jgi:hypothetical protein
MSIKFGASFSVEPSAYVLPKNMGLSHYVVWHQTPNSFLAVFSEFLGQEPDIIKWNKGTFQVFRRFRKIAKSDY